MEKRFKFFLVLVSLVSLLIPQSSKSSLTPAPTYAISGKVTDSDGNPIAGALITATTTLTDWTHQIYLPAILQPFSGTTTPARTLPPNHFSTDLILQSPDTAHRFIKFPVQNQTVATFTGSTDVNGYYVLTGLSSGSYTLSASKKGYVLYPDNFSITLPPSASGINFSEPVIDPDEMVTIPSGIFQMGCDPAHNDNASCAAYELPLHAVALDTFQITKYEVTNSQYALCVASGACPPPKHNSSETRTSYYGNPDFANYPVIWVKWQNAADYCAWAGMRLPTEAEWEKAARGTASIQTFPWGDETPDCTLANFLNSGISCAYDTKSIGSYPDGASPYGVMDMAGNVWEWVNDWYQGDYYEYSPPTNPLGPQSGTDRIIRGGSWDLEGYYMRNAYRDNENPENSYPTVGFRCAKSLP